MTSSNISAYGNRNAAHSGFATHLTRAQFAKQMWEQVNSEGYEPNSVQDSMSCIERLRTVLRLRGMELIRAKTASERQEFGTYYVTNAETGASIRSLAVLKVAGPPFLVRTAAELMAGHFYNTQDAQRPLLHKDGKRRTISWDEIILRQEKNGTRVGHKLSKRDIAKLELRVRASKQGVTKIAAQEKRA